MRQAFALLTVAALLTACGSGGASPAASVGHASPTPDATHGSTPTATHSVAPTTSPQTKMANLLEHERQRNEAPGMLALVGHGEDRLWATAGTADVDGTPISATTHFRIGSVTKPIVAALVLIAVDDGLLALDDEVGGLIPGVLREPEVTVRQLLDHTSGVFDEGNEGDVAADVERISNPELRREAQQRLSESEAGKAVKVTDRVWIALAETHDRYFAPGTDYHYSNVNYQVLGMILERLTGSPLADLLAREIVAPLGLDNTWLAPADVSTPGLRGYDATREPGKLVDVTDDITWFGNGGNGGVVATADELLAMMAAIVSGELLSDDLTTEMKTANLADYGLGLATYSLSCGTFYGHAGSVLGLRSIALVSDDGRDGVVAALNVYSERDPQLTPLADTLLCRI